MKTVENSNSGVGDNCEGVCKLLHTHPETSSRGDGSNSRNYPGMWLAYSDSTWRVEHAHICETSQRVANSEIKAFRSWKFWPLHTISIECEKLTSKTQKTHTNRFIASTSKIDSSNCYLKIIDLSNSERYNNESYLAYYLVVQ